MPCIFKEKFIQIRVSALEWLYIRIFRELKLAKLTEIQIHH